MHVNPFLIRTAIGGTKKHPKTGVDRMKKDWYNVSEQGRPIDGLTSNVKR